MDKFQSAKDYRDSIAVPGVKSQNAIHEIYLDLEDEAGGIAIIASLLAFKGISIKTLLSYITGNLKKVFFVLNSMMMKPQDWLLNFFLSEIM